MSRGGFLGAANGGRKHRVVKLRNDQAKRPAARRPQTLRERIWRVIQATRAFETPLTRLRANALALLTALHARSGGYVHPRHTRNIG